MNKECDAEEEKEDEEMGCVISGHPSRAGRGDALSAPMKQLLAYQRKLTEARKLTTKLDGRLSKLEQVRSPGLPCANPTLCVC